MNILDNVINGLYIAGRLSGEIKPPDPERELNSWENWLNADAAKMEENDTLSISIHIPNDYEDQPIAEDVYEEEEEWVDENGHTHRVHRTHRDYTY
ncbi:MAG: hypothetical protein J6O49_07390 [Bacteroidaceae bacterium]|nr:hypothetical protein [Bacteroidaceae bacterium]